MKVNLNILMGMIVILIFFIHYLSTNNPSSLVIASMGVLSILMAFNNQKNFVTIYLLTFIGLIIYSGIILIYIHLNLPKWESREYMLGMVTFLLYIALFVYGYIKRNETEWYEENKPQQE